MVDRLRLGRGGSTPIDADGDEYGNYKKFEEGKNNVKEIIDKGYDDMGQDHFQNNLDAWMRDMNSPDQEEANRKKLVGEADNLEKTVKNEDVMSGNIMDEYMRGKRYLDNKLAYDEFQLEQDIFSSPDHAEARETGRLSPVVKEEIYRSYLQGTKIRDLSLKHGILPQRVKAVVY